MKGGVQWNPVFKRTDTCRSAGQRLTVPNPLKQYLLLLFCNQNLTYKIKLISKTYIVSYISLSYDDAIIQWISSCHKNGMDHLCNT